ncbi:hypothetical protein Pla110_16240 [Polystyrenella longa]|uniref:DUF3592 domain-containing protein n=1 Tax=Polystyrenella longa TaxID=2528007 RepID=A0A518CL52_9PLAN|nr:DUF3592 domain-containing protein [Polystyrenella longa]QDU79904.1 hypothetical protein Pla110_16240 [Polystyrenella longa]
MRVFDREEMTTSHSKLLEPERSIYFNGSIEEDPNGTLTAIYDTRMSVVSRWLIILSPIAAILLWLFTGLNLPVKIDITGLIDILASLVSPSLVLVLFLSYPVFEWRNNRQRKKGEIVCLSCSRKGELHIPDLGINLSDTQEVYLELVHDIKSKFIQFSEEQLELLSRNTPQLEPHDDVEFNYIIKEDKGYVRYPIMCNANNLNTLILAQRVSKLMDWPLLVHVGERVPEHRILNEMKALLQKPPTHDASDSQIKFEDSVSEEWRHQQTAINKKLKDANLKLAHNNKRMNKYVYTVMLIGGIALSGWLLYLTVSDYHSVQASQSRTVTKGMISQSNIKKTLNGQKAIFVPNIIYEYTVEGAEFTGNRIEFFPSKDTDRTAAAEIVAQYPIGTRVNVFYDPFNPEESTLSRGDMNDVYTKLLWSLGLLVCCAILIPDVWKHWCGNSVVNSSKKMRQADGSPSISP